MHQFVPLDRPAWVRRFLDHWRPDVALWIESELWPTLIVETRERGIPMVLLNGRMSEDSFARWKRVPSLARELVGSFALCLGQDENQAARLRVLGARHARSVGDLKTAAAPLPVDAAELAELRHRLAGRKLWLAASTHPGEEDAAADAHAILAARHSGLLTVIAPRHPRRGDAVASSLAGRGLSVARRSRQEPIDQRTDVLLVDTLGELGLFYRLARIVFVGGSLTKMGGHNPLEAARLGCAVIHGPDTTNCAAVAADLASAGATRVVSDAASLAAAVDELLSDPAELDRRRAAAEAAAARPRGVLDAVMAELAPFLTPLAPLRDVAAA
jgi:3-deoxy-D-manno-octulosonic-acid transferase